MTLIIGSVAVVGMGSSIFHPEASRVAQIAAGYRKGLAQSIFQVGGNGGAAIGPLLAALIVLPHGKGAVIWFAFALVLGAAVVTWVGRWYQRSISTRMTAQVARAREACILPNVRSDGR